MDVRRDSDEPRVRTRRYLAFYCLEKSGRDVILKPPKKISFSHKLVFLPKYARRALSVLPISRTEKGANEKSEISFSLNPRRELRDQPSCCRLFRRSEPEPGYPP